MAIRIGCGSWTDDAYVGVLYPKGLPKASWLSAYARWFERIEVNSFTYAIPSRQIVARWVEQTPASFLFDVKLPPAFSTSPGQAADGGVYTAFMNAVQPIIAAKKLGTFLLTLPPSFTPAKRRLEELDRLAERMQPHALAVELRHRDWVDGETRADTLDYLRKRKLVWVAVDLPQVDAPRILPPIDEVTHPTFAYMRLHGRNPAYAKAGSTKLGHHHDYTQAELQEIIRRIERLAGKAKHVHVSLNNHARDFAPKAAIALRRLLGQPVPDSAAPAAAKPLEG